MNQAGYQGISRCSDQGYRLDAQISALLAFHAEFSKIEALGPLKGFMNVQRNVSRGFRQEALSSGALRELFQAVVVRPIEGIKSRVDVDDEHRNLRARHQAGHAGDLFLESTAGEAAA